MDYFHITLVHNPDLPLPRTDLLCVLLEQAELEALIKLEFPDVPGLVQVLPGGVQLIQQLANPRDQALGVGVANATAAATAAATGAAVTVGERLAALNTLKQPGSRLYI